MSFNRRDTKTYTSRKKAILGAIRRIFAVVSFVSLLLFSTSLLANSEAPDMKGVRTLLESSKKEAGKLKVPKIHDYDAEMAARDIARTYHSRDYQARLKRETRKLKRLLFSGYPEKALEKEKPDQKNYLMPDERIYLFISSSIPIATLRNYAADMDRLRDPNVTMVMRGFIGGMRYIKPTIRFISKILLKDSSCDPFSTRCELYHVNVEIDPMLFSRYRVEEVPAIVYARGIDSVDPEQSEGLEENTSVADAYVVYGDVSLEYALERIRKKSGSSQLQSLINQLRRDFY